MTHHEFYLLPERAFARKLGARRPATLEGGGKGAPPAPDYAGAAQATAAGNLEAARATTAANRVNQYTPYGSLVYSHEGSNPDSGWSATQTLSPTEQQKLQQTNDLSTGLLGTAQTGLNYVNNTLSTGGSLDEGKLAQPSISGQAVQDAIMSRLNPTFDRQEEALRSRLANQGLMEGSAGYTGAMRDQTQRENDAYIQAALQGIQTGQAARQQGIQEQYAAQDRPLNIINALRTGNQVQTPSFVNVPQQQQTAGPDLLGAATNQGQYASGNYAAQMAQQSQLLGGLMRAGMSYALA